MTLRVVIQVPAGAGPYEAAVAQHGTSTVTGKPLVTYLKPGESMEVHIHSGMHLDIAEAKQGTKDLRAGVAPILTRPSTY